MRQLSEAVAAREASFLEAPVAGSRPHVERGVLTYLVGGEADVLDRVRPILDVLGGAVHHIGPVGAGAAMKLAVNTLFAAQAAALAEVIAVLSGQGVAPPRAVEVLNALPTASPAAARVATLMAEGTFEPNFPIHLVAKDLAYAAEAADGAGVDAAVVKAVRGAFEAAERRGYGGDDIVGIAQLHAPRATES